jgi:hypothetical protein
MDNVENAIVQDLEAPFVALAGIVKADFAKAETAVVALFKTDEVALGGEVSTAAVDLGTLVTTFGQKALGYIQQEALSAASGATKFSNVVTALTQDIEADKDIQAKGTIFLSDVHTIVQSAYSMFKGLANTAVSAALPTPDPATQAA